MEFGNTLYSINAFLLDPKWLIDPKLLFVGPRNEGAHAKVYEGKVSQSKFSFILWFD